MTSFTTIQSFNYLDDAFDIQELKPIEIFKLIKDLFSEINYLKLENSLLKKFLEKHDGNTLLEIEKLLSKAPKTQTDKGGLKKLQSKISLGTHSSRGKISNSPSRSITTSTSRRFDSTSIKTGVSSKFDHRISVTIKIELAEKQCNNLLKKKNKYLSNYQNKLDDLTDTIEEVRDTCKETKNTYQTFNDYVVLNGINPLTRKIPTERFYKFLNDWYKVATTETDKLRLRTITLKQKFISQSKTLIAKKELKTILRPVDFEQLKIEKTEYTHVLEEKNVHFIGLKKVTAMSSLALATQSKMLLETVATYNGIDGRIAEQEALIDKFELEAVKVKKEIVVLKEESNNLRKKMNLYTAPDVLEYALKKTNLNDLERELKIIKRGIYIATIKYDNLRKKLSLIN